MQDTAALTIQLKEHDAVLTAFSGHAQQDVAGYYLQGFRAILQATRDAGVPRLLAVASAGSLEVAPGVQLLDTREFPAAYKGSADGARQALNLLRAEPTMDWTMLSPSAFIEPGQRTGQFRPGTDQLLANAADDSRISVQDYAVAMIDELECPAHSRRRFTMGENRRARPLTGSDPRQESRRRAPDPLPAVSEVAQCCGDMGVDGVRVRQCVGVQQGQLHQEQFGFLRSGLVDGRSQGVVDGLQTRDGQCFDWVHGHAPHWARAVFRAACRRVASRLIQRAQMCWSGRNR